MSHKGSPHFKLLPVLLAVLWCAGCYLPHENAFLESFSLNGFEQATPLVVYNRANIFDYIDGEAEVYLPLGFQLLYNQSYQRQETDVLMTVDAYDMGTSKGARGVFSQYTGEGGSGIQGLGESAWTDSHILLFQRGKYFFRVWSDPSSEPETEPELKDMLDLGRAIDRAL